jgi:hypothetical protein
MSEIAKLKVEWNVDHFAMSKITVEGKPLLVSSATLKTDTGNDSKGILILEIPIRLNNVEINVTRLDKRKLRK